MREFVRLRDRTYFSRFKYGWLARCQNVNGARWMLQKYTHHRSLLVFGARSDAELMTHRPVAVIVSVIRMTTSSHATTRDEVAGFYPRLMSNV